MGGLPRAGRPAQEKSFKSETVAIHAPDSHTQPPEECGGPRVGGSMPVDAPVSHRGEPKLCRLTAYVGSSLPADTLVFGGSHSLYEQSYAPRELIHGTVNADGYGVVWYRDKKPVRVGGCRPIWQDRGLPVILESSTSQMMLATVRNATEGIPVDETGNAPLVYERWTFILNGFVEDFRASYMRMLRARLPDDLYGQLRGSSDTETLFLLALSAMRDGASLSEALEQTRDEVCRLLQPGHEAQLTMILADGEELAALRTASVKRLNSLYLASGHPLAPDGTLLASERLDRHASWRSVGRHQSVQLAQ